MVVERIYPQMVAVDTNVLDAFKIVECRCE